MAEPDPALFASLARDLAGEDNLHGLLSRVVDASVAGIEGAEYAGITIISRRSVATPAATDELVRVIDEIQYSTGEGPCLDAAVEHESIVVVDDLSTDDRWPHFSAGAVDRGIRSMLSFQLYTAKGNDADTIGALNIYASTPRAFTGDSVHTGTLLSAHAAAAAAAAFRTDQLLVALNSRDSIGQAKGILMERFKLTPDQAFDLLITASQHSNLKLRDVADQLTATGELVIERTSTASPTPSARPRKIPGRE